jgi:hypothetical protein
MDRAQSVVLLKTEKILHLLEESHKSQAQAKDHPSEERRRGDMESKLKSLQADMDSLKSEFASVVAALNGLRPT